MMLTHIGDNAKQGAVSEEFDKVYKKLSEEIKTLRQAKTDGIRNQNKANQFETRTNEMDKLIGIANPEIRELDEELVKRLI